MAGMSVMDAGFWSTGQFLKSTWGFMELWMCVEKLSIELQVSHVPPHAKMDLDRDSNGTPLLIQNEFLTEPF